MSFDEILDARQEMSESFKRKMKETNLSDFPCDHDVRKLIFDALRERYGSLNGCVGPTWAGRGRLDAC